MNTKTVKLESLLPIITDTLSSGGEIKLPITGVSMTPLLKEGRDFVILKSADGPLKKYDLPLYRRDNGMFVLHRVIGVQADGSYVLCGDGQILLENGITDRHIIGLVSAIERKGRSFSVTAWHYKLYCRIWRALMPVRKYLVAAVFKARGLRKKWKHE